MIDLKQKPETGWNVLLVLSLLSIPVAAVYGFAKPAEPASGTKLRNDVRKAATATRLADDRADAARRNIRSQTSDTDPATLATATLDRLTQLADKHKLQLTDFRSEKTADLPGMKQAPFTVIVDGRFPDVVDFVASLERPDSKLAVALLEIAASDKAPGRVTATLGLNGYLFKEAS